MPNQSSQIIGHLPEWLQYASIFQSAIAAFVGFLGVILTIAINGILGRRLETIKYMRERRGIASALRAELELISNQMNSYINILSPISATISDEIPILKDIDNFGIIFNALASQIRYLDSDVALSVTQAFLRVRSLSTILLSQQIINDRDKESRLYYISDVSKATIELKIIYQEIKFAIAKLETQ